MRHATLPARVPARRRARAAHNGLLYPLDLLYSRAGVPPPTATEITAADIPAPYRSLLEHDDAMTHTLEEHFGGRIALRLLATTNRRPRYVRRALLVLEASGRPVEMGAISLRLDAFGARITAEIVRGDVPLGRILSDHGVKYTSRPRTFLAVTPNMEMMGVFWMPEARTLYGRRTEILHRGAKIGDIVEVLPLV